MLSLVLLQPWQNFLTLSYRETNLPLTNRAKKKHQVKEKLGRNDRMQFVLLAKSKILTVPETFTLFIYVFKDLATFFLRPSSLLQTTKLVSGFWRIVFVDQHIVATDWLDGQHVANSFSGCGCRKTVFLSNQSSAPPQFVAVWLRMNCVHPKSDVLCTACLLEKQITCCFWTSGIWFRRERTS